MKKYTYHGVLLLAALSFSSLLIFSAALTAQSINPFNQIFWRLIFASIIAAAVAKAFFKQNFHLTLREAKYVFVNSLIYLGGFTTISLAIYLGSPVAKAVALNYAYPISVLILSYVLFKEKPTKKSLLAAMLSVLSVYVLLELWKVKDIAQINLGDFFAFLNSFFFAGIIVYGRKLKHDTGLNSFKSLFFTFVFMLPELFLFGYLIHVPSLAPLVRYQLSFMTWLTFAGLAIFGTVVPLGLINIGVGKVKAYTASILLITEPIWVYIY